MSSIELLKFMFPDFLREKFEIVSTINSKKLHLYFEEKAKSPKEFDAIELVFKRFLDEITIQYFPLRDKFMYSQIKRHRWTNKTA